MPSKTTLGIALTLVGINGITFAVCGFLMACINRCLFEGGTLLAGILFLTGLVLLRSQLKHHTEDQIKNPA